MSLLAMGTTAFESQPAELPGMAGELYTFPRPRAINVRPSPGRQIDWIRPVVNRLQASLALQPDWDGYGSVPPSVDTLVAALEVLQHLMGPAVVVPAVAPTPTGGVQFEWHRGGWDIEVEVLPTGGTVAWGENLATGEAFHGSIDEAREELVLNLKRISLV